LLKTACLKAGVSTLFTDNEDFFTALIVLLVLSLAVGLFALLPAYLLFWSATSSLWRVGIAGIIAGLAMGLMVEELLASIKERKHSGVGSIVAWASGLAVYTLPPTLLAVANGMPSRKTIPAVIGVTMGIAIFATGRWAMSHARGSRGQFATQMRQMLDQYDRIAILGKPGAGKSTLVQFLALTFARKKAGDRQLRRHNIVRAKLGLNTWYFPMLIPLRKVARALLDKDADGTANLLFEVWKDRVLPSDIRVDLPERFLLKLLKKGHCIVLLDGLDEVADDREFRVAVREIRGFSSRYIGNKFIITSRFSGWRGGLGSSFHECQIDDLTDEHIDNFIDDWYKAIEESRVSGGIENETAGERTQRFRKARSRAMDLKEAFKEVEGIRALAENPLLLSLICFVHYNQSLPRERLSLYEECSKLLLMQWDLEKGLVVDDTDLTLRQKETIMQEIAFALHTGKLGENFGRREATGKEIVPIIEERLRQYRLPVQNARSLFQKLIDRSGIVVSVENYADRFAFSHLTFQEFYAAKHIYRNQLSILSHFAEESPERLTSWWKEVALLYVSMTSDSSAFIRQLWESLPTNVDDLANKRLQVASQCLAQAVAMQDETLEPAILDNLLKLRLAAKGDSSLSPSYSRELRSYLLT